jgi:uncharacterized protein YggU (UPF0235/DUF167 family)
MSDHTRRSTLIRVKAFPGARKEHVEIDGETLRIFVREPAERNMANARIRQLVAEHCGVPLSAVRMRTGARSLQKTFDVILDEQS